MLAAKRGGETMAHDPLYLCGSPETRGRQQAALAPKSTAAVRAAVLNRLAGSKDLLGKTRIQRYLADQWEFMQRHGPAHVAETEGLAAGYGMSASEIFAYLHLGILDHALAAEDGCSTLAATHSDFGPFVAKNRDYGGEHRELQRVFHHSDPDTTAKQCLFIGSLGSPGAFSSGMNSAGLALVDTRVDWPTPGVGWLRYYLMTELLWRTDTVAEAVAFLSSVPHAGGGSLALADASGAIATVECGHPAAAVQTLQRGTFVHTNHYVSNPDWRTLGLGPDSHKEQDSTARLRVLQRAGTRVTERTTLQDVVDLFSSHDAEDGSLCRHSGTGGSGTISTAIFCCKTPELLFLDGNPCTSVPRRITFR